MWQRGIRSPCCQQVPVRKDTEGREEYPQFSDVRFGKHLRETTLSGSDLSMQGMKKDGSRMSRWRTRVEAVLLDTGARALFTGLDISVLSSEHEGGESVLFGGIRSTKRDTTL